MCVQVPCVYILHTASSVTERNSSGCLFRLSVPPISSRNSARQVYCTGILQILNTCKNLIWSPTSFLIRSFQNFIAHWPLQISDWAATYSIKISFPGSVTVHYEKINVYNIYWKLYSENGLKYISRIGRYWKKCDLCRLRTGTARDCCFCVAEDPPMEK